MAIKLNQSQARSAKKFCRSTAERRADWAENLINNIDSKKSYCDSFGNARPYVQENGDESQDYSMQAIFQHRDQSGCASASELNEQAQENPLADYAPEVANDYYVEPAMPEAQAETSFAPQCIEELGPNQNPTHVAESADQDESVEPATVPQTFNYAERDRVARDSVMRTTEFLRQPNGTFIRPHYDRSGILTRIDFSDGCRFFRADSQSPWLVLDQSSKAIEGADITSVSIDSRGNVVYIIAGEKAVIHVDGAIE